MYIFSLRNYHFGFFSDAFKSLFALLKNSKYCERVSVIYRFMNENKIVYKEGLQLVSRHFTVEAIKETRFDLMRTFY